jgi:hypothetical protein
MDADDNCMQVYVMLSACGGAQDRWFSVCIKHVRVLWNHGVPVCLAAQAHSNMFRRLVIGFSLFGGFVIL